MQLKHKMSIVLLTAISVANTNLLAQATTKAVNQSAEKGKEGSAAAVAQLKQAGDLVGYARENQSALAMLTAVQMIKRVRLADGDSRVGKKESEGIQKGEQVKQGTKGSTAAPTLEPAKLLAEAKGWAGGRDKAIGGLLDAEMGKAKPSGTLGSTSGPIVHRDQVKPRLIDNYTVEFRGGEVARVAVLGDRDTDLDLYVFDENGNEVAKDTDRTDQCIVEWTPKWTGKFTVKIANLGYVPNNYALLTN